MDKLAFGNTISPSINLWPSNINGRKSLGSQGMRVSIMHTLPKTSLGVSISQFDVVLCLSSHSSMLSTYIFSTKQIPSTNFSHNHNMHFRLLCLLVKFLNIEFISTHFHMYYMKILYFWSHRSYLTFEEENKIIYPSIFLPLYYYVVRSTLLNYYSLVVSILLEDGYHLLLTCSPHNAIHKKYDGWLDTNDNISKCHTQIPPRRMNAYKRALCLQKRICNI